MTQESPAKFQVILLKILGWVIALILAINSPLARSEGKALPPSQSKFQKSSAKSTVATPQPSPIAPPAAVPTLSVLRTTPTAQLPFWKRKEEIRRKMRDERAIVVSVRREDLKDGKVGFTMAGAGWVNRPKDFCFQLSQQYPKLKEVSDHFRAVNFDPNTRHLFLVTEALGYQARMILKMTPVSEDWRSEIQWEVIWGHFQGMQGLMGFEKVDGSRTEVSVSGHYEAKELPFPKALMGFALEVVTQKVAEKMRSYLESQPLSVSDGASAPSVSYPSAQRMMGAPESLETLPKASSAPVRR